MSEAAEISTGQEYLLGQENAQSTFKISFVVEWANTTYNGVPRFFGFLDIFLDQWQDLVENRFPSNLSEEECEFLQRIDPEPEFLLISGEPIPDEIITEIGNRCGSSFSPDIRVSEGLEYYAMKNLGADLATGDILCFIDSDVFPDKGWLAYLMSTFANPQIRAVSGQPYVAPVDLFAKAFALGWTYDLPDKEGRLFATEKFFANNVAFLTKLYRQFGFAPLNRRTRGSAALLGEQLMREGYPVWQNGKALVDHPAPAGWKHLVIRAIAHGRDMYMKRSEERSLAGLVRSQKTAAARMRKGVETTYVHWKDVGLSRSEVLPAVFIQGCYYGLFSLGGILTHLSPDVMGRRFRL